MPESGPWMFSISCSWLILLMFFIKWTLPLKFTCSESFSALFCFIICWSWYSGMNSSETSDVTSKFMFPNLSSNSGCWTSLDLRSLPTVNYYDAPLVGLELPILYNRDLFSVDDELFSKVVPMYEEQHIIPKTTARNRYPLLWTELDESLFRTKTLLRSIWISFSLLWLSELVLPADPDLPKVFF